jgi:hypothetical protein
MTATVAAAAPAATPPRLLGSAEARKVIAVVALAALADWLFWQRPIGISLAIFSAALGVSALVCHTRRTGIPRRLGATLLLIAALLPLVAQTSILSILFAVAALTYFAVEMAAPATLSRADRLENAVNILLNCGWRAVSDVGAFAAHRTRAAPGFAGSLLPWVVPLVFCAVFTLLLVIANPIIEQALSVLSLERLLSNADAMRVVFWLLVASAVWPFLFVRIKRLLRRQKAAAEKAAAKVPAVGAARLFGPAAILRSLFLFNALFAVETVLDIAYLWGGVELPDGMSYAAYAHRGAYPLIVTALLAAAFVIAATTPGSEARRSPLIRWLVYLWIAQNVLLVMSSLLRLDLYVSVYSLTYWRVAAFIWMLLVAAGLVLILVQIAAKRSGAWLIGANLVSLGLTLYVCSFVSFARVIAEFNVDHSAELTGQGTELDVGYVWRLGPQAIPAMDRFVAREETPADRPVSRYQSVRKSVRNERAAAHLARLADWRAWTYWDGQIADYLRDRPRLDILPPVGAPSSAAPK